MKTSAVAVMAALCIIGATAPVATAATGAAPEEPAVRPGPSFELIWERDIPIPSHHVLWGTPVDTDGDGTDEILLVHTYRDEPSGVLVLNRSNGEVMWSVPFEERSTAVAADLDGDGSEEVIVACAENLVVYAGPNGREAGSARLRAPVGEIAAGPIDGSPGADIACTAGDDANDMLVVLTGSELTELWTRRAVPGEGPFARGFGRFAIADVEGDGSCDLLVSENGNHLLRIGPDGVAVWNVVLGKCERFDPSGVVSCLPVVVDHHTGARAVAVGCFAGAVVTVDAATGDALDRFQFGKEAHESHLRNRRLPNFIREMLERTGEPVNELRAVELDGTPGSELVFGCADGFVYALDPEGGAAMWRLDTRDTVYERCVPLRTDDRSEPHLLIWDSERTYLVDGRDGRMCTSPLSDNGLVGAFTCTLNGDGFVDLVCITSEGNRVHAWSTDAPRRAETSRRGERWRP